MNTQIPYLRRLNNGRTVWLDGGIVTNLENHQSFKGTVRTIQHLLYLQTVEPTKSILTYETEEGTNAHLSFLVPTSINDLKRKSLAYKCWADETFGVMSRLSEYSRSQLVGWYASRQQLDVLSPGIATKLDKLYTAARDLDLLSTVAAHDPQKNRSKSAEEIEHGKLRVVTKNEEGIFVSGAKTIATAAPYVDELLITSYHKRGLEEAPMANVFYVPTSAQGLHMVCRESFASTDTSNHPLSSRFDEMDAVLIFDNVLIPWERVLVAEDPELAWKLRTETASSLLSQHQTVVRLISKLESVVAIGNELAETAGATEFLHVKEKLSELIIQLETIKGLLNAAEYEASEHNGIYLPQQRFLTTARNLGTRYYPRALEILQQIGASGLLQVPSTIEEINGPIGDKLQAYYGGTHTSAFARTKFIKLAWDLIGSQLGARHELYERFYSGDPVRTFAAQYQNYSEKDRLLKLVEEFN